MGEVKRVTTGCDNPLVELCGRGCPAGRGEQYAAGVLFIIERAGHGEELWPGPRRLEVVLRELLSVIIGNLHIRPEGQEILHPTVDAYGHEGWIDGLLHLALLRGEWGCQSRIEQFPKTHIVLRKQVNLHAPGLLHGPQALHQRFWWDVNSPDTAIAYRFKPRQHLLSDDMPFRLGQAHRYRHGRLGLGSSHCQHERQHTPEHGPTALHHAHRHSPSRSTLRSTASSIAVAWLRGNCPSATNASSTSMTACGAHTP